MASSLKFVVNTLKVNQIVKVISKGKTITMKVLKFKLTSGIVEILITNVFDEDFSVGDFRELYFKR